MLGRLLPETVGGALLDLLRGKVFRMCGDGPLLAERIKDDIGIADAVCKLASVTSGPVRPADATNKKAT